MPINASVKSRCSPATSCGKSRLRATEPCSKRRSRTPRETERLLSRTLWFRSPLGGVAGRESMPLGDQKKRAALDLVVDPAHVLADNAERNELDSSQEEHRDENGGPARHPVGGKESHDERVAYAEQGEA